ncbi:hypothetical protein MTR67_024152 [Solanum verrucosum]|uniref:Integrase zinc-binding domain-containing protein n=1 Tax=Solanum verrucosum TaxID=315347 RepID=A0AAF0QYA1_SOLVR|nr:hypothetical protein MTR67_024152 [Solanum verrucosum]
MRGEEDVLDSKGILRIGGRICVPKVDELIRLILEEVHCSRYSIHPRAMKIYHDMSQHYWWFGIKKDIADFVLRCLTCQKVMCEHQWPEGISYRMPILTLKWEWITMDFVVGLSTTVGGYDSIWVLVDSVQVTLHSSSSEVYGGEVSQALYYSNCAITWALGFHCV